MLWCSCDIIVIDFYQIKIFLTHKWQEMHGCPLSTVATDALVLKHQAISIHSIDWIFIALDQFHTEIVDL